MSATKYQFPSRPAFAPEEPLEEFHCPYSRGSFEGDLYFTGKNVRLWAEAECHKIIGVYPQYLNCMCAITSGEIFKELKKQHIECTIQANHQHFFTEAGGFIIDITATQFFGDFPKVVVKKRENEGEKWFWRVGETFNSIEDAKAWQIKHGWPSIQLIRD